MDLFSIPIWWSQSKIQNNILKMIFIQKNRKWITYAVNIPNPADIYLLKVNKRRTKARCEICSKLTLNVFHTLLQCFYCWLWTSNCRLGSFLWISFFFFAFSLEPYFMKTRWNIIKATSRVVWPWYLRPKIRKITGKKRLKIL